MSNTKEQQQCATKGCGNLNGSKSKTLCNTCWWKEHKKRTTKKCDVVGCENFSMGNMSTHCKLHYTRFNSKKNYGPPERLIRKKDQARFKMPNGEIMVNVPKVPKIPRAPKIPKIPKPRKNGQARHIRNRSKEIVVNMPGVKSKYMLEKNLVMMNHLGRPLEVWERIKHKDRNKENNSLENLELLIYKRPFSARVEDVLKYAEEVLQRYAPHKLKESI